MTREAPGLTTLLGIGIVSAGALGAGIALGWLLDGLLHTFPIMVVVGIALGIAGGIYYSIAQIRPFLK
ncbi:MAG: AtpZ/AtpI family protein [Chloroflexota bacterium]|nr:AtpZ/AtpI family protein [Actinomycetota bacterium]